MCSMEQERKLNKIIRSAGELINQKDVVFWSAAWIWAIVIEIELSLRFTSLILSEFCLCISFMRYRIYSQEPSEYFSFSLWFPEVQ